MVNEIKDLLEQQWERYEVPDTSVSAEFPAEPWVEDNQEGEEAPTNALALDYDLKGAEVSFDLAVSDGQSLEVESSEELARHLRAELKENEDLDVISVEPKMCEGFPGALQKLRLKEGGEIVMQWLVIVPDATIFAGVTFLDLNLEKVGEKFFESLVVSVDAE